MVQQKEGKSNPIKGYFTNLKNLKKNFQTIQNNPYAFQKFQYYFIRLVLIIVAVMIIWNIGGMILNSSGSKPMAMLGKAFMLLVMVMFIVKLYGMNKQMKKVLLHYEQFPSKTIDNSFNEKKLDLKDEIDSILNKYDDEGKLK